MKKKFDILSIEESEIDVNAILDHDDYLESILENRLRIRHSSSLIISACGMLISASFVVLFFLIKEGEKSISVSVYILFFAVFLLMSTIGLTIYSVYILPSVPVATKGEQFASQSRIYRREKKTITIGFFLLIISMLAILVALAVFAKNFSIAI